MRLPAVEAVYQRDSAVDGHFRSGSGNKTVPAPEEIKPAYGAVDDGFPEQHLKIYYFSSDTTNLIINHQRILQR